MLIGSRGGGGDDGGRRAAATEFWSLDHFDFSGVDGANLTFNVHEHPHIISTGT